MVVRVCAALGAATLILLGGCAGNEPAPQPEAVDRGPAPPYAEVAARYNQRVAEASHIWARSTTRIWYTDDEGREQSDQADGHLQYIAPRNLLLSVTRLGETYAYLGSDDERYWWISLAEDDRGAVVGRHDEATPQAAARAGLPVHPLDLLALVGVSPMPPEGNVAWSPDGRLLVVTYEGRWGSVVSDLDPETLEPASVVVLREARPAVSAELGEYVGYTRNLLHDGEQVRLPGQVFITAHDSGARIRMNLSEYRATSRWPNEQAFNLERLLQSHGIAPEQVRAVRDTITEAPGR